MSTGRSRTDKRADVTVVIPAWNLGSTLREAVASIRAQDESSRIIIVDNASDDPLPSFSGTTVVRTPFRMTIGEARNAGLRKTKTPYVLFMDGDDVMLPGALGRLRRKLDRSPELVAVSSWMVNWNPRSGHRRRSRWPYAYALRLQRRPRLFAAWNAARNLFPLAGCALIRTEAAKRVRGFPALNYAEDWCFHAALPFRGRIEIMSRPGKLYRIDSRHTSLLDQSAGSLKVRLSAARELRVRLRAVFGRRSYPGILSYALAPVHLAFAIRDSRRGARHA